MANEDQTSKTSDGVVKEPVSPSEKTHEEMSATPSDSVDKDIVTQMGAGEVEKTPDPEHKKEFEMYKDASHQMNRKLSAPSEMPKGGDAEKWEKAKELSGKDYGKVDDEYVGWLYDKKLGK